MIQAFNDLYTSIDHAIRQAIDDVNDLVDRTRRAFYSALQSIIDTFEYFARFGEDQRPFAQRMPHDVIVIADGEDVPLSPEVQAIKRAAASVDICKSCCRAMLDEHEGGLMGVAVNLRAGGSPLYRQNAISMLMHEGPAAVGDVLFSCNIPFINLIEGPFSAETLLYLARIGVSDVAFQICDFSAVEAKTGQLVLKAPNVVGGEHCYSGLFDPFGFSVIGEHRNAVVDRDRLDFGSVAMHTANADSEVGRLNVAMVSRTRFQPLSHGLFVTAHGDERVATWVLIVMADSEDTRNLKRMIREATTLKTLSDGLKGVYSEAHWAMPLIEYLS